MEREERFKKKKEKDTTLKCQVISYQKLPDDTLKFGMDPTVLDKESEFTLYQVFGGSNFYYMYVVDEEATINRMKEVMLKYIKDTLEEKVRQNTNLLNFINTLQE